jgi:hypothetical protein
MNFNKKHQISKSNLIKKTIKHTRRYTGYKEIFQTKIQVWRASLNLLRSNNNR